ncbi:iron ABC transporter ATP-binding protein [Frigoribacterium salinisoli]
MIEFSDLTKAYADEVVLGPVAGRIGSGGITALVGPNGAGKSTLLSVIARLLEPTSGTVRVAGLDVATTPSSEIAKRLAILRQDAHVLARLTVRDLVGFGRFPHSRGRPGPDDRRIVGEVLEFLGLEPLADRYVDELSGGQRQRAFVAMVLAQDTEHVLLDEPLNNLDIEHSVRMMRHLRRAADELGRTVVVVVHDINFAAAWADRVIALRDGRIHTSGTVDEVVRADVLTDVFRTPVTVHEVEGRRIAVYYRGD